MRRVSSTLAAAGLLAGAVLSAAPGAYAADEPVLALGGPAEVALRPHPATGAPQRTTIDVTVDHPAEDAEEGGFEGEYTVTFDLSGLTGVADVRFGETGSSHCTITGTTGTCTDAFGVPPGRSSVAELELTAAKGAEPGATGDLDVTGKAEGATFTAFTSRVTVGGPDLVMHPLALKGDVEPGQVQDAPLSFTNAGTADADGVRLTLRSTHGLGYTQRYANCDYATGTRGWTEAVCDFPGTFEAGATYTLAEPIGLKMAPHAYRETFLHRVEELGATRRAAHEAGRAGAAGGTGPELTLWKAPATARALDLDPLDNQQEFDFRAENTADFAAYGETITATAGQTVEARVGFRNEGPAWIGNVRSGEPVATVDVTVPAGATVTAKPAGCAPRTAEGGHREEPLGAPRYVCDTSIMVFEDEDVTLPFELRIDKVVPDARGAVTVRDQYPSRPRLGFDPEAANNTAQLVLNPADTGSDTTGGTTAGGSTSGSTSGTATGGTAAGGATTGGTTTAGTGSTSGTTGSTTGSAATTQTGGLASTGSAALPVAAGAAALVVAGAAAVAVTRRRAGAS
ncbi:peptidase [Streptomyces ficellus]|uniref:Peptidase n=1 Tax=Streptomyces ficellus TaxID=1977088 RepID=A0A6I6FDD9_9ACTN|nr:peptidase [Streptomyces ficellus]QGV78997.1 peptidase [Streptomyces ficellus]